jgi:hypothetical protein
MNDVLNEMLDVLTEEGTELYTLTAKDDSQTYVSDGKYKGAGVKFDGELFVITNGLTASCGDIMTGVIKNIGGIQVGEPTYGKGISQGGVMLPNEYMAFITGMYLDLPTFGRYHGKPITPDVSAPMTVAAFPNGEILPLDDVASPITADTDPERIKAFQQRLSILGYNYLDVTGELDARTVWLVNAILTVAGIGPVASVETGIPGEVVGMFVQIYEASGGYAAILAPVGGDPALEYVLNYDVTDEAAAA